MVLPIIAREVARQGVRYFAQALRYQDSALKAVYSRPFLPQNFNRYAVKGLRHGLSAGATYEGFNNVGNFLVPDGTFPQRPGITSSKKRKARNYMELSRSKREYCPKPSYYSSR